MAKIDLNDYLEKLTEPEDRETVANRAYQRELFEQYVTKDGNFPEQRAQLLEDFRVGKELTGPKGLRRKLGAFDLEYFGRAYLAHYFVRPSPKFHGELDRIWREGVLKGMNPEVDAKRISRADGCRRAIEAPRGHAKSTTFTFKDDLHAAVYGYKHYIIILSDSSEQAEGFLVDIKTELEENAALKEDFGELEGKVWKSSVILLANGVKIEAIGSGKKIRGRRHKQWRPDLIVCDDLENDENVNTPEQRKKLRDWFYKAVSKAGDTYTDIVYIGTLLHFDALLANVAKNPSYKSVRYQGVISFATNGELWDAWESIFTDLSNDNRQEDALEFFQANREAMLEGTAVLWEEKLSYKRMTEPGVKELRPYWQYDAVNDSKTRPSHLAMDGRVFMADDPIWDTWFPPNGFKCRCTVKTLSKRQMEQRGLTVETEAPRAARLEDGRFVNILPDPQFDTNPAKVRYQPDLTGYPEPLKKAYQEREKGNTPP